MQRYFDSDRWVGGVGVWSFWRGLMERLEELHLRIGSWLDRDPPKGIDCANCSKKKGSFMSAVDGFFASMCDSFFFFSPPAAGLLWNFLCMAKKLLSDLSVIRASILSGSLSGGEVGRVAGGNQHMKTGGKADLR